MFLVGFHEKYKELEKSARGPLNPLKIILENENISIELEVRAWKCPGTNIVDGTVLYCTVQLYCTSTMPGSSQFYNIERFLMTGLESQICSITEIAWDTPYTEDILLPEATLLIVLRLPRVRAARRSGLEQSGATASTSRAVWWTAATSTSGTVWTV